MSKKAQTKGVALVLMLACLLSSLFSPVVFADVLNTIFISFDTTDPTYALPGGGTYSQLKGKWVNLGEGNGGMQFEGGVGLNDGSRGDGHWSPNSDIYNWTFTVCFMAEKKTPVIGDDGYMLIAGIWRQSFPDVWFNYDNIILGIQDGDTDSPKLWCRIEADFWGYTLANFYGAINYDTWYTVTVSYNYNASCYHSYVNGKLWGQGNFSLAYPPFLNKDKDYNFNTGAYISGALWKNWFKGVIDYIEFKDSYTSPFEATHVALWYHCNEGDGDLLRDYSGGAHHGTIDRTMFGYSLDNPFGAEAGYSLSGSTTTKDKFVVRLSQNVPSITQMFSSSFWFKFVKAWSDTGYDWLVYLKPFEIRIQHGSGAGLGWFYFILRSDIGGSIRSVTSTQWSGDVADNANWMNLYCSYDQAELRLTVIHINGTVCFNQSTTCAGEISDFSPKEGSEDYYGFYYRYTGGAGTLDSRFDEFKLSSEVFPPYEMNQTWFGPEPDNLTDVTAFINTTIWFDAQLNPSTIYIDPTTLLGYSTLIVNSSSSWLINLTTGYDEIMQFFDMTPSVIATGKSYHAQYAEINIQWKAKNTTGEGTYLGEFTISQQGPGTIGMIDVLFLPFKLIYQTEPRYNRTADTFKVYLEPQPLDLNYDGVSGGTMDAVTMECRPVFGLEADYIRCDFEHISWRYSSMQSQGYNDTFVSYFHWDYREFTTTHLTDPPRTIKYSVYGMYYMVDETVKVYGNFTVYHTVKVWNRDNPDDWMLVQIVINIYQPTVSKELWAEISPTYIEGQPSEVFPVDLYIYANYETEVVWQIGQVGSGWESTYITVVGRPLQGTTNYSVELEVKMPLALGVYSLNIKVVDLRDATMQNSTILTVNCTDPGADFSFVVTPDFIRLKPGKSWTLTAQVACQTESRTYWLVHSHNCSDLHLSYPDPVGSGYAFMFNIGVTAGPQVQNGSYLVKFTCYYATDEPYRVATVIVEIYGQSVDIDEYEEDGVPQVNMTTVPTTLGIPVTGIGPGLIYNFIAFMALTFGIPMISLFFGLGLLLMVLLVIAIAVASRGTAPISAYILCAIPLTYFNVILGFWDQWIMIVMSIFGVLLLSMTIGNKYFLRSGGGGGGGED